MKRVVQTATLVLLLLAICPHLWASAQESSFTQQDRERLIRLEANLENLNRRMDDINRRIDDVAIILNKRIDDTNKRIDDTNKRFDDLNHQMGLMFSAILAIIALIVGLFALIYTYMLKADRAFSKIKDIDERQYKLEKTLKEHLLNHPNTAEANKHAGLL